MMCTYPRQHLFPAQDANYLEVCIRFDLTAGVSLHYLYITDCYAKRPSHPHSP